MERLIPIVLNRSVYNLQLRTSLTRLLQGELEHRSPKARYRRTDRNSFVKQLTRIEHRQARIRRIGDTIFHRPHFEISEVARSPQAHHHIGLKQKYPVHIGSYLISHPGDPAIKVGHILLY